MKTLILWRRRRARTFKVIGTATADCSVLTITDMWHAAERGEGTLAIVDAPTAAHARALLASHISKAKLDIGRPGIVGNMCDGKVIVLGTGALLAVAGASEGARNWDARLRRDGKVKLVDTRAIGPRSDGVQWSTVDAFGDGFRMVRR